MHACSNINLLNNLSHNDIPVVTCILKNSMISFQPQVLDRGSKCHSENSSNIALAFTHSFIPLYFSSPVHSLSMNSLPTQYSSQHIRSYKTLKISVQYFLIRYHRGDIEGRPAFPILASYKKISVQYFPICLFFLYMFPF